MDSGPSLALPCPPQRALVPGAKVDRDASASSPPQHHPVPRSGPGRRPGHRWRSRTGVGRASPVIHSVGFNAYSEIGQEVTLRLFFAKDYKGHSLVRTSFTEPPNMSIYCNKITIPLVQTSFTEPPNMSI